MAPILGDQRSQELMEKIRNVESLTTARELGSLLKK
jgi:hypothetical protein